MNGGVQAHIQNNLHSNCGTTGHKAAGNGYSILFNYAGSTPESYDPITRHNIVAVVFEDGPDVTQQKWIVPPPGRRRVPCATSGSATTGGPTDLMAG